MKFLRSRQVFVSVGSVLNLQPSTDYFRVIKGHRTDGQALMGDWAAVGRDLRKSMDTVKGEVDSVGRRRARIERREFA